MDDLYSNQWKISRYNFKIIAYMTHNRNASINIGITGALFTLSLSIVILNYECKEGANYVNIYWGTPILPEILTTFQISLDSKGWVKLER